MQGRTVLTLALIGIAVAAGPLWWSSKPRLLGEPYSHYATEQWRIFRGGDLLQREVRKLIGVPAVDCGSVQVDRGSVNHVQSASEMNACITRARVGRQSFIARWDMPAIDAEVVDGLAGSADGRLYHFQYLEGPHVPGFRRVNLYECGHPITLQPVEGIFDCR